MLAVLATLAFLVAIWLCATIVADTLEQSGSKVIAALNGRSPLAWTVIPPIKVRVSQRYPSPQRRPPARVVLRVAA